MQCEMTAAGLARLLAAVKPAVAGRTTNDALKCVKLEVADGNLSATATDMELCVTARLPVGSGLSAPGVALVSHERLAGLVRSAPDGWLRLGLSGDHLALSGPGVRWELPTRPAVEFPDPPEEGTAAASAAVPAAAVAGLLRRSMFCTTAEAGKGALPGVLLTLADGRMTAVGCDSKRLSLAAAPVDGLTGGPRAALVPVRACRALLDALPDGDLAVSLGNQFRASAEALTLVCATVHHSAKLDYPDLLARELKKAVTRATVAAADLRDLARRAIPLNTEDATRLELTLSAAGLEGASRTAAGAAAIECPAADVTGPEARFAVNPLYLRDLAAAVLADDEPPALALSHRPGGALVLAAGDGFRHLIATMTE